MTTAQARSDRNRVNSIGVALVAAVDHERSCYAAYRAESCRSINATARAEARTRWADATALVADLRTIIADVASSAQHVVLPSGGDDGGQPPEERALGRPPDV